MLKIVWEDLRQEGSWSAGHITRAKVPGGWLVRILHGHQIDNIIFIPDPNHEWK